MANQPINIEWRNLSRYPDRHVEDALDEFAEELQQNYPQLPTVEFSPLASSLHDRLSGYFMSMMPGRLIDDAFADFHSRKIFVLCDGDEDFALAYQEQNELAHWGVAIPCRFAIAWEPNKYLLWHETLHLMNAKDCYNKFGINKCPVPQCVMRRAPCRTNCGDRLTLCSKNVKRIRVFASECSSERSV